MSQCYSFQVVISESAGDDAAMLEMADRLAAVRIFFCTVWRIDNTFVDALPQNNLLETIQDTPINLTPDRALTLLS